MLDKRKLQLNQKNKKPTSFLEKYPKSKTSKTSPSFKLINYPKISPQIPPSLYVKPLEHIISLQKQHHRKAFEYLSKALKLDNENSSKMHSILKILKFS